MIGLLKHVQKKLKRLSIKLPANQSKLEIIYLSR